MRLKRCVGTIVDIHKVMAFHENRNALVKFFKLKEAIGGMDMDRISEQDVLRIEGATNALLAQLSSAFQAGEYGPVYLGVFH